MASFSLAAGEVFLGNLGNLEVYYATVEINGEPHVQVFATDGTIAGTQLLVDLGASGTPGVMATIDGRLIFEESTTTSINGGTGGYSVETKFYGTDGTIAGTQVLADITQTAGTASIQAGGITLATIGSTYVFATVGQDVRIYATDGTSSGTHLLLDLGAVATPTILGTPTVGGRVIFEASTGQDIRIYATDGTVAGSQLLVDLGASGTPGVMTTIDGRLIFEESTTTLINGGTGGYSVETKFYGTDGTIAGTQVLADITQTAGTASIQAGGITLATIGSTYVFATVGQDVRIYATDGTSSGTHLLLDLGAVATPTILATPTVGGRVIFEASTGQDIRIYATDGTIAGSQLLVDLGASGTPGVMTTIDGRLIFEESTTTLINGGTSGYSVETKFYGTDGTIAGTQVLADIIQTAGAASIQAGGITLATIGDTYVFATLGQDVRVYATDGTAAGTHELVDAGGGTVTYLSTDLGRAFFTATNNSSVTLYDTDGVSANATLVATASLGSTFSITNVGSKSLVDVMNAGVVNQRLWVNGSDGSVTIAGDEFMWGPVSGSWDSASNWDDTTTGADPALVAPGANDSVTISAAEGGATNVVTGTGNSKYLTITGATVLSGQFSTETYAQSDTSNVVLDAEDTLSVSGNATIDGTFNPLLVNGIVVLGVASKLTVGGILSAYSLAVGGGGYVQVAGLSIDGTDSNATVDDASSTLEVGTTGGAASGTITIDTGANLAFSGGGTGTAINAPTIVNKGTIQGTGIFIIDATSTVTNSGTIILGNDTSIPVASSLRAPTIVNTGTIVANSGLDEISGTVTGNGQIQIGSNTDLLIDVQVEAGGSVVFTGTGSTLQLSSQSLDASGIFEASIVGFGASNSIDYAGTVTGAAYASGILTLSNGSTVVAKLNLTGSYNGATFLPVSVVSGEFGVNLTQINLLGGGNTSTPPAGTNTTDNYVWTGPVSGSWDSASNWDDTTTGADPALVAPGANDSVTINATGGGAMNVVAGTGNSESLTITGSTVLAGQFSTGTFTLSGVSNVVVDAGNTLSVSGDAAIDGAFNDGLTGGIVVSGAGSKLTIGGTLSANSNSSLAVVGGGYVQAARLSIDGTFSSATVDDASSTLEVGTTGDAAPGTITVDAGANLSIENGGGNLTGINAPTIINEGTIQGTGIFSIDGTNGITNNGTIILDNGAFSFAESLLRAPTIVNTGTIVASSGLDEISGTVTGNGQIQIASNTDLVLDDQVEAGGSVVFTGTGSTLTLDGPSTFGGAIKGFQAGDQIDLAGIAYKSSYEVIWLSATDILEIIDTANPSVAVATLDFTGLPSGELITLSADAGIIGTSLSLTPYASAAMDPNGIIVSNISGQAYTAYEELFDNSVYVGNDYFFTKVSGQPYSSYEYDYSAGNDFIGSQFFYTSVPNGANYTGYEYDYDGGGNVTRIDFTGVTGTGYSSYEYDYVGGIFAGAKFEVTAVPSGAAYSSYELDYNSSEAFTGDKFFFANVTDQSFTNVEEDFDASGNLAKVLLSGVTGQSYSSLEEDYSGGTYTGYKAFYTGISGQSYTGEEVDVSASNQLQKVVYTGMTSTPYSSLEEDFSNGALSTVFYDFTNVSGASAYAYQVEETPQGAALQSTYDNNDGSHAIIGFGAAAQTFTSIGNDTMTGGGSNETFVFQPIYGSDTITDFYQFDSGAGHDTISLSTSEFANFAAVQSAASNVGSNLVINAADGDTLTLANLNTTTLAGLSADFTFHA